MSKLVRCLFTSALFICLAAPAAWAQMDGRQIIQEMKNRHESSSEYSTEVMLLVDKKGNRERRLLKSYSKKGAQGLSRYLMVFLEPANVRGTAMLTWEHKDRDDDQWLYLPSMRKMQRIASGSKQGYFMGTDFTYGDLEPESLDDYTYTILRSEKIGDHDCWVIEAKPVSRKVLKKTGYGRRLLWVRKDIFFAPKIAFYDRRNRLVKTQTCYDLTNIKGKMWRAKKVLMDNQQREHKTVRAVKNLVIDRPLSDDIFTSRFLLSERHLQ